MTGAKQWLEGKVHLKSLFIGIAIGVICSFLLFGNRYAVVSVSNGDGCDTKFIKINKWTGKTWICTVWTDFTFFDEIKEIKARKK